MGKGGKLRLSSLRPADRTKVQQGIRAREQGKPKSSNPYARINKGQGELASSESIWWDLGYEGAYE